MKFGLISVNNVPTMMFIFCDFKKKKITKSITFLVTAKPDSAQTSWSCRNIQL